MTFIVILLLTAVKLSLAFRVDFADPVLYHEVKVPGLHQTEAWNRNDGDWALLAGLWDSATSRPASRMRANQLLRKLRWWQIRRSNSAFSRAGLRRSYPNLTRVAAKDRGRGILTTVSQLETVPDNDRSVSSDITASGAIQLRKKSRFGSDISHERFARVHPYMLSHPVYLGMGMDAVDAALRTYINIATSTRNTRKTAINPVNFVGRR